MKLIKRYKNRRFYDTEIKKSIKFADIKSYVLDDVDFKIIDNASQKDITMSVLSSVMGDVARDIESSGNEISSVVFRKEGVGVMDVVKKITLASIGAVNLTREKAEEVFDELVKKGEAANDESAQAVKEFVDKSMGTRERVREWMEETYDKIAEKFTTKVNDQISELSMRLEQLNTKLMDVERKLNEEKHRA